MPAHNAEAFVEEAVSSVAFQTFEDFELIIVDDGSEDTTREILNCIRQNWQLSESSLKVLFQKNRGTSEARNRGIETSSGALIAFIDADDRWHPTTLAELVATMNDNPESDIVCPRYRRIDELGNRLNYLGEVVSTEPPNTIRKLAFNAQEALIDTPAKSATGVLVRREALEAGKGFSVDLRSNNDIDCWLRILRIRQSNLSVSINSVADYRMRSGQLTSSLERMQEGHRHFVKNQRALFDEIGVFKRMAYFGTVHAYWSILASRQGSPLKAIRLLATAVLLNPSLALPRSSGFRAAMVISMAVLPAPIWQHVNGLRQRFGASR